jgi:hypothetical protein
MNSPVEQQGIRELDRRRGDDFEVTLYWSRRTGRIFVTVEDLRTSEWFRIAVAPEDALDAFRHPYAYSCRRGRPLRSSPGRTAAAVKDDW